MGDILHNDWRYSKNASGEISEIPKTSFVSLYIDKNKCHIPPLDINRVRGVQI